MTWIIKYSLSDPPAPPQKMAQDFLYQTFNTGLCEIENKNFVVLFARQGSIISSVKVAPTCPFSQKFKKKIKKKWRKLLKSDLCSCVTQLWFFQKSAEIKDSGKKNVKKWRKHSVWCNLKDLSKLMSFFVKAVYLNKGSRYIFSISWGYLNLLLVFILICCQTPSVLFRTALCAREKNKHL